jgi:hypothetical protein
MRVPEEPVCIDIFRKNPVFTSLHLKSPVRVHRFSVADPDPNPDPRGFGPSGSFYHKAKIVRKTLILLFCGFFNLFDFLTLNNDLPSKSIMQTNFFLN